MYQLLLYCSSIMQLQVDCKNLNALFLSTKKPPRLITPSLILLSHKVSLIITPWANKAALLYGRYSIRWKLLTSTGFSWKTFFYSIILLGEPHWKKSARRVKSRPLQCQNQNFQVHRYTIGPIRLIFLLFIFVFCSNNPAYFFGSESGLTKYWLM